MVTRIRSLSSFELDSLIPDFAELLADAVNHGASLGFNPTMSQYQARDYWHSLRVELQSGSPLLPAAYASGRIVGTGQLALPTWPNARHRAELQKVFVAAWLQGQGVGRQIICALHDAARECRRSLVHLNTRRGEPPEQFYKGLGYCEAGVIPGYTIGPAGERYDTLTLYQELTC